MYEAFISHIQSAQLLTPTQRYLLACSGGLDSMALAHLLLKAKIPFELAHVNFQLRGEESQGDEAFLRNWGAKHGIEVHVHTSDTKSYAREKGISIQMAAREIRYLFFEEIRSSRALSGIVLAHHQDDQLETIFLHLLRGTGIEGITGMNDRKGWLIRPLLIFSRKEIETYMQQEGHAWREDRSNASSDYKRNKLRHEGLPAIYALEQDARKNLLHSFDRLKDTGKAFLSLFESWKIQHLEEADDFSILPYEALLQVNGAATLLYFWLRPYGFNSDQAKGIFESLKDLKPGRLFLSSSHQVGLDRNALFLSAIPPHFVPISISYGMEVISISSKKYNLGWETQAMALDPNPSHAQLDADALEYPLVVRNWEEGDRFIPLGMQSEKKISDFLIDQKVPLPLKKEVKVVVSGKKIAWVWGMRIADWAKITSNTTRILHIKSATS
ncbi:MAG: hypothetical protein RL407_251 [Bacteroidota bacterium]|jgi:tRNA(Ile)-lysidine synthase